MIRLCIVLLMVACTTVAMAAVSVNETPAEPGEWGFRPFDGKVSGTNPPGFVWRPQKDAQTYAMQVASDDNFNTIVHEADDLDLYCHCPPVTFDNGRYYWRFRFSTEDGETSDWSTPRTFVISEESAPFPMPERQELLSRIPGDHPRLFIRPEQVQMYQNLAQGRLKESYDSLKKRCDQLLENPPDSSEPPKYPPDLDRREDTYRWKQIWWGNRERTVAVTNGAATLAFTYMLGGDERYAAEARRLLLAACSWDPKGATGYRYNDEAGMPFAYYTSRAYTWLHDYLSEEDRQKVRDCMAVRGKEMYDHLSGRLHIWKPYSSHANRAWHFLGEVATAFHGEIEGTGDWAWFALNVFFNSYPVWNDTEGGWHEGIAYWSSYLTRVTWWLATMKATYDIDGYKKPFFSNAGDFALYVIPPGETMGGFGDLTYGYRAERVRSLMTIFARSAQNPHWMWFAEKAGGASLPGGYMGFIYDALPPVETKPPTDLPDSKLFPGVGVAALHNDLVDRTNDVQFMMKSSPMGTQSHGYESQNAFLLSVAGNPIFIRTGRRDNYGSPHHRDWMWETESVNSITVNGEGQMKHSRQPMGKIVDFTTSEAFDYMVGEAADAYAGKVDRFTRAALFIKPHTIVIFDVLEAPQPSTYQWMLHAPNEMKLQPGAVFAENNEGAAVAQVRARGELNASQTNEFDPPPGDWVELEQWHVTLSTTEPAEAMDFVSVLRPYKTRAEAPPMGLQTSMPADGNALGCEIELPEGKAIAVWRKSGDEPISCAGLTTDGDCACVVLDESGAVHEIFSYNAESVAYQGVER